MKRHILFILTAFLLAFNAAAFAEPLEYGAASEVIPVKPWLGITVRGVGQIEQRGASKGADGGDGVLVSEVIEGGPADKAGLKEGDIVMKVDGRAVTGPQEFVSMIRSGIIGSSALLTVNRSGQVQDVSVIIGKMPELMGYSGFYHHGAPKDAPYGHFRDLERGYNEYGPGAGKNSHNYGKIYLWALENLNLDPDGRKTVQSLYNDYRKNTIKAIAEIEVAEVELNEMLEAEVVNLEKVRAKLGEIASKKAELRFFRIKGLQDLKRLLSDEDRARLKDMLR